jgi:hypothetical protein
MVLHRLHHLMCRCLICLRMLHQMPWQDCLVAVV